MAIGLITPDIVRAEQVKKLYETIEPMKPEQNSLYIAFINPETFKPQKDTFTWRAYNPQVNDPKELGVIEEALAYFQNDKVTFDMMKTMWLNNRAPLDPSAKPPKPYRYGQGIDTDLREQINNPYQSRWSQIFSKKKTSGIEMTDQQGTQFIPISPINDTKYSLF